MDLKSFVAETLVQIVAGVTEAQKGVAELSPTARVNPTHVSSGDLHKIGQPSPVEFDVALTVSESTADGSSGKAGAKIGLLSVVSLGASAAVEARQEGRSANETVSRVKSTVQLAQPSDLIEHGPIRIPYDDLR